MSVPVRPDTSQPPRCVLTIAGSDSGGGAGIQADLKTFQELGVFGTSVVTAVTAQNTLAVEAMHPVPPEMVRAQLGSVMSDLPPEALKTGMLGTADVALVTAACIREHALAPYVLDPVMVATSGDTLADEATVVAVREALLPLSTLVTPNLDEAERLTRREVRNEAAMRAAGRELLQMGAGAALVKGGHLGESQLVDVLVTADEVHSWRRPRVATRHTHGTGCTLSAACVAYLARGFGLEDAVDRALAFVERSISEAPGLGAGHGPVNHWVGDLPRSP